MKKKVICINSKIIFYFIFQLKISLVKVKLIMDRNEEEKRRD